MLSGDDGMVNDTRGAGAPSAEGVDNRRVIETNPESGAVVTKKEE